MNDIVVCSADEYHRDEFDDRPSLSAGIARIIVDQSPLHAWTAHPRLNPDYRRRDEERFDIGTVAHRMLLEGESAVHVVPFDDWRTKAAKDERDQARAAGMVPLLARHAEDVGRMVAAARRQLPLLDADPPMFTDGKPEQTLLWEDDGVLCRARLDWLRDDLAAVDDLKTTSASANPERWTRTLFGIGADVQAAWYLRGLSRVFGGEHQDLGQVALRGRPPEFRWFVQETYPPYAGAVVSLEPGALELANAKVDLALSIWKRCLDRGEWPGYDSRIAHAQAPAWEEVRWTEREIREEMAA